MRRLCRHRCPDRGPTSNTRGDYQRPRIKEIRPGYLKSKGRFNYITKKNMPFLPEQFAQMGLNDKELNKFVLDQNGNVAVRVKDVTTYNDLGYFVDPAALNAAHPTANPGDFAIVGSTDTVWIRDDGTNARIDSGTIPPTSILIPSDEIYLNATEPEVT
jgi:hypothetical protein